MRVSINIQKHSCHAEAACGAMSRGILACGDVAVMRQDSDIGIDGYDAVVLWGFWGPQRALVAACDACGIPWVFIDSAYWQRERYYKVTVRSRMPDMYFQRRAHSSDRWKMLGLEIAPWKTFGDVVIVAGMSAKASGTWGYDPGEWEAAAITRLNNVTDRPIIYRPKPNWNGAVPIEGAVFDRHSTIPDLLSKAWAVVTHHSNVASDAILSGVPVFCDIGVAAVLGKRDITEIENPAYPEGRLQWACDVAYCQWSIAEMASGQVWMHLKEDGLLCVS